MADTSCVLCGSDISTGTAKVKRKKLYGCAAEKTKLLLDHWSIGGIWCEIMRANIDGERKGLHML